MSYPDLSSFIRFQGRLSDGAHTLAVSFQARVNPAGALEFEFDSVVLNEESKFLFLGWHKDQEKMPEFDLSGTADDGTQFRTQHLSFRSMGDKARGEVTTMKPEAGGCRKALIHRQAKQRADKPVLCLLLKGFRNLGQLNAECELGRIAMNGMTEVESIDSITGYILIVPHELPADVPLWRKKSQDLLQHVRHVMCFATSTILRDPVEELYFDDGVEVTIWSRSEQTPSVMPVFHFLDQQPIFDVAVNSFFAPPIDVKHLFFAIEWFAMDADYNEARLTNAMTALENLVEANLIESDVYIQPARTFDKTRRVLRNVIRQCLAKWSGDGQEEVLKELNEKLSDLNRRSLLRKVKILAERWGVPLDDVNDASVQAAKQARDRVVHRGQYYEDAKDSDPDLWTHAILAREVVARMILCAIGYQGRYISYVGGHHNAQLVPRMN